MTRRQQAIIGGLGALVLATLVILVVVATGGTSGRKVTAGTTTSSSSSSTSSSSTSSSSSSTTAPPAPTTTAAGGPAPTAGPTTTAATQLVVTGQGAELRPPATPDTRTIPSGGNCQSLGDPGWTATCGRAAARTADLTWLIETKAIGGGGTARRALVFKQTGAADWMLVLMTTDDAGTRFTNVKVALADVSGDGNTEVAFGFTRAAAGGVLAVDLVDGPGTVVVHRELPNGVARVSTGQLDTWRRSDASHWTHEVVQQRSGTWYIVASSVVLQSDVPPSQL
jgi:hypothetical protein